MRWFVYLWQIVLNLFYLLVVVAVLVSIANPRPMGPTTHIEPQFVCSACGKHGAEVRPHFEAARMGTAN